MEEWRWPAPGTMLGTQCVPSWRSNCRDLTRNSALVGGGSLATDPSWGPWDTITPLAVYSLPG